MQPLSLPLPLAPIQPLSPHLLHQPPDPLHDSLGCEEVLTEELTEESSQFATFISIWNQCKRLYICDRVVLDMLLSKHYELQTNGLFCGLQISTH